MRSRGSDTSGSASGGGQIRHRNPILRHGFAQVPRPILKARGLSDKAKLVYWLLLDYSWQGDSCYPGQLRMAADLSTSLASITRALRELRAYRLITWERRGNQQTNVYWIEDFSNNPRLNLGGVAARDSSLVTNRRKTPPGITDPPPVTNPEYSPVTTPDSSPVLSKEYPEERDTEEGYEDAGRPVGSRDGTPGALEDVLSEPLAAIGEYLGTAVRSDATLARLTRDFHQWGRDDVAAFLEQMRKAQDRITREVDGRPGTRRPGRPRSATSRWLDAFEEDLGLVEGRMPGLEASGRADQPMQVAHTRDEAADVTLAPRLEVTAKQVWMAALDDLRETCTRANFATWLKSANLLLLEGDVAVIGAPSTFACDWLAGHLQDDIAGALAAILGRRVSVRFEVAAQ